MSDWNTVICVWPNFNFCKLFDWMNLFNYNYNFIKIVNSLEYFYWKKYSLFCHIVELSTLYTSVGVFPSCFIAAHEY